MPIKPYTTETNRCNSQKTGAYFPFAYFFVSLSSLYFIFVSLSSGFGKKFEKVSFWRQSNMTMYEKIQALCKKEGFEISNLGDRIPGLNVTKGSISKWKSGAVPRASTLKIIAEYFGVTPEYLTSDDSVNIQSIQDNHGIIGHNHAPVTITNGSERKLSQQAVELLNIFEKLSVMDQAKLLVYANDLVGNK